MNKNRDRASFVLGAAAMALIVVQPGCQTANTVNDPVFVEAADQFVNTTVGPEYEDYVMQDPALGTPGELTPPRQDRINNIESFRQTVQAAKDEINAATVANEP